AESSAMNAFAAETAAAWAGVITAPGDVKAACSWASTALASDCAAFIPEFPLAVSASTLLHQPSTALTACMLGGGGPVGGGGVVGGTAPVGGGVVGAVGAVGVGGGGGGGGTSGQFGNSA